MDRFDILLATIAVPAGEAPPKEFQIFGPGMNVTESGTGLFDKQAATDVMEAYKRHGVDKMIDLEHLSLDDKNPNFDPDARGWMKLELRGTEEEPELWAVDVSWTADGARRLNEKTQRYISPAFAVDTKSRRIVKLHNVAMTAVPATHGIAPLIAASLAKKGGAQDERPCSCHENAPAPDARLDCLAMLNAREYLRENVNVRANENSQSALSQEQSAAYPWDQCIADQLKRGHNEDSAKRICAYIKNQNASVNATETKKSGDKMALQGKDAELAGAWLSQVKSVAESAQDGALKELASKVADALGQMLGQGGAEEAAKVASEQAAQATANATVAAAARKITGKEKPEEIAATVSAWKDGASKTGDANEIESLRASVRELTAKNTESEIKEMLASNRDKCNPAFEQWALKRNDKGALVRSAEDVKEALETRDARPAQARERAVEHENEAEVTLTAADREICKMLETPEAEFLKHKKELVKARGK